MPSPLSALALKLRREGRINGTHLQAGHPIYVVSNAPNKKVDIKNVVLKKVEPNGGSSKVNTYVIDYKNDPHKLLLKHQGIIIPMSPLQPGSEYLVDFDYTENSGRKHKTIRFKT